VTLTMLLIADSVRLPPLHAIVLFCSLPPTLSVPPRETVIGPPVPLPKVRRCATPAIAIMIGTRIASPKTRYTPRPN
jgi:hypothetical protein